MAENDELTPDEIAQIRSLLHQQGIDSDAPIQKANKLPSERALGYGVLSKVGTFKRLAMWTWKVAGVVIAILLIPKDYLDLQEFYVPKYHAAVEQVAELINNLTTNPPSDIQSLPPNHQDKYYAFNPEWQALSDVELQRKMSGPVPRVPQDTQFPSEKIAIIGATGVTAPTIISQSGTVRGLG